MCVCLRTVSTSYGSSVGIRGKKTVYVHLAVIDFFVVLLVLPPVVCSSAIFVGLFVFFSSLASNEYCSHPTIPTPFVYVSSDVS